MNIRTTHSPKHILFGLLFTSFLFVITACRSVDHYAEAGDQIIVVISEQSCEPDQWTVNGGDQIHLDIENQFDKPIYWAILQTTGNFPYDKSEMDNAFWFIEVPPQEVLKTSFNAPAAPARYPVYCGPTDDFETGAPAKLIVVQKPVGTED